MSAVARDLRKEPNVELIDESMAHQIEEPVTDPRKEQAAYSRQPMAIPRKPVVYPSIQSKVGPTSLEKEEPAQRTVTIPIKPPPLYQPLLAISMQAIFVLFIIVSLVRPIYIRRPGSLSDELHILYVTGMTLLATLVSAFTTGQIRFLWCAKFASDKKLVTSGQKRNHAAVLAGLGDMLDSIRYWPISLSFLIIGLITTSIVAALTPTTVPGR
jgi:hypothetical protein